MLRHSIFIAAILLLLFATACKMPIKPDQLYGKWKYIKVENPNANPPDSVSAADLKAQAPYIRFSQNGDLVITWGGKVLSHGKFTISEQNIQYTETLADGTKRQFPFWVSELSDARIVFQTMGADGSKVTAVKF